MKQFYLQIGKRAFDIAVAVPLLVLLLPLLVLLALLSRIALGGPVLYSQFRAGYQGRRFVIRKFRTMTNATDADGELLPDELRLTRFGRFLRATSLDELPELWNVLIGEMSLVGPRPLLIRYMPRYSARQLRRHEVRPGLTGLAQVRGRNAVSWEQRFEYDVEYVERASLSLDIRILMETVLCVSRGTGISAKDHATCPEFMGSQSVDWKDAA